MVVAFGLAKNRKLNALGAHTLAIVESVRLSHTQHNTTQQRARNEMRKYKIDELNYARKKLRKLEQSGKATAQELNDARDNLLVASDSYYCDLGFDN